MNPFALRLGACAGDEFFCGLVVRCGIDAGIVFGFDDVAAAPPPPPPTPDATPTWIEVLLKVPLKLCKFACVNGDGAGDSPPDDSSESPPVSEPELSSWKK